MVARHFVLTTDVILGSLTELYQVFYTLVRYGNVALDSSLQTLVQQCSRGNNNDRQHLHIALRAASIQIPNSSHTAIAQLP